MKPINLEVRTPTEAMVLREAIDFYATHLRTEALTAPPIARINEKDADMLGALRKRLESARIQNLDESWPR